MKLIILMSMDASYDCLVDIIKSDPGAFTECGPILDFIYEDAKRCRENRNRSTCLWDSSWGRLLLNPEIRDSTSWYARLFIWSLPYDLFVGSVYHMISLLSLLKNAERWTYLKRRITVRFQLNLRFQLVTYKVAIIAWEL